jgi:hypothetical protein
MEENIKGAADATCQIFPNFDTMWCWTGLYRGQARVVQYVRYNATTTLILLQTTTRADGDNENGSSTGETKRRRRQKKKKHI